MPVNLLPASNPNGRSHFRPDDYSIQRARDPQPSMSLTMKVLTVATLVGFGILHLIAGTIMQRAPAKPPIETMMFTHNED